MQKRASQVLIHQKHASQVLICQKNVQKRAKTCKIMQKRASQIFLDPIQKRVSSRLMLLEAVLLKALLYLSNFSAKNKIFSFLQKAKIFIDSNILQDFLLGFGIGIWAVGNHMSVVRDY